VRNKVEIRVTTLTLTLPLMPNHHCSRPIESCSGTRGNILVGPQTFSWGRSEEKIFELFSIWHILAYFIFLADGPPKRRGARGSLPSPTPPSRRACIVVREMISHCCEVNVWYKTVGIPVIYIER